MKHILILLSFLLLFTTLQIPNITYAQDRKPPALIGSLVTLGTFTEVQKQIIFNHLQAKLSERFELVSQRRFEEAQNMAFEELDYDQCTEENCIRFIQDTLQVESFFSLQLVQEGKVIQLTFMMLDLDRKVVKTEVCEDCSTLTLNGEVTKLMEKMYEEIDFDRLELPYDDRMDPSEKYPELAEAVRASIQIFYEIGYSNLKLLFPKIKEGGGKKVTWSLIGVGIGLGKNYLVEFRSFSGSGKADEFYFGTTSVVTTDPSDIETANGNFKLSKQVIYYSPDPDSKWPYGLGVAQWNFVFESTAGEQKLSLTSAFFDIGIQTYGEDYPIALKIQLDPYGISVVPSLGIRFFF